MNIKKNLSKKFVKHFRSFDVHLIENYFYCTSKIRSYIAFRKILGDGIYVNILCKFLLLGLLKLVSKVLGIKRQLLIRPCQSLATTLVILVTKVASTAANDHTRIKKNTHTDRHASTLLSPLEVFCKQTPARSLA